MSDERILAVDTTFGACSAAVVQAGHVLGYNRVTIERGHAEALAPMVEAMMREAQLDFAGINRLAVTTGPGSFTGQRVGLAFMRGLRLALHKPLTGVTSLAAMAEQARHETGRVAAAAVQEARRDEVYLEAVGRPLSVRLVGSAEAVALLRGIDGLALAGTAAARIAEALTGALVTAILAPDAVWVGRLAAAVVASPSVPRPLYLRPPDAKRPQRT